MAAVTEAIGLLTKTKYAPSDIALPQLYAKMVSEPLIDDQTGVTVAAVRRSGAPHFRRLGSAPPLTELPKKRDSDRHNALIADFLAELDKPARRFRIFTRVFSSNGDESLGDQTLFALTEKHDFSWFSEQQIRFDDYTVIRPDICGRGRSRIAPIASDPSVIIEVVDSHFPEPETLVKLFALSRMAYHIYFFVIGDFPVPHAQKLNKYTKNGPFELRITWALMGGELMRNGVIQNLSSIDPMQRAQEALTLIKTHCKKSR